MSRSPYISREGYEALNAEIKQLWKVERPQVTQQVQEAAALGDRSENADYIYGKRRLREIDRRVRYLAKRLDILVVVDYSPRQEGRVFFGAYVQLWRESATGNEERVMYRIVGSDEIDAHAKGCGGATFTLISVDSPMAKALIGKTVDEAVVVQTPTGSVEWLLENIAYQPHAFEKAARP